MHFYKYKKCKIETSHLIHGCVLGGGFFSENGSLIIEHPLHQSPYFFWKYFCFKKGGYFLLEREAAVFSRFNRQTKKYTYFIQPRLRILPRYEDLEDFFEILETDKTLPERVERILDEISEKEKTAFIKLCVEKSDQKRDFVLKEKYNNKYSNTNILYDLNRQSLAVWFMDNGGKNQKFFFLYCRDCYNKEQIQRILLKKWGIKTWIYKNNEKSTKIFVLKESSSLFKNLVSPYIFQSME